MKKNWTRLVSLLLAVAMTVCMLSACSSGQSSSSAASSAAGESASDASSGIDPTLLSQYPAFANKDELKITWFEQGWTGPEADKDFVAPEIEKITNLKLDYEGMTVPTSDDYTQQLNLMIAGGEIPDAFFGGIDNYTREIYKKLGESGKIWDLTGMVTEADYPNLYALIHPELDLYQTDNGQNWFLPTQTGRGYENLNEPPHGIHINTEYLEKLGMAYPTTADEFYDYVYRCVNELGTKGLLLGENLGGIEQLYQMFFPLIGSHDNYSLPFDVSNNYKVCNYQYSDCDEMMAAAKYVWKFAQNGLLDPEVLTLKTAQFMEKASSGEYAAVMGSWWDIDTIDDTIGKPIYIAPPLIYASETVKKSREIAWTDWVGCWSSLIINKSVPEQTVRHLLAAMDWMATKDGQLLLNAGIEGVSYTWTSDNIYAYTDDFKEKTGDLDWNKTAAYGVFYYAQLVQNAPAITQYQETPSALLREDNKLSWDNRADERARYSKTMDPTYDYYFLVGEKENELMPAIQDAMLEYWAKVISAKSEAEVEQLVHEWNQTCVDLGINDIIAERQASMDAIIAKMSK